MLMQLSNLASMGVVDSKKTSVRVLRGDEVNFTGEARQIQSKALNGQVCVVRLGQIVFFSTEMGDAWMLDPEEGYAACLARDRETRDLPIRETANRLAVEWGADYEIEAERFTITERGGSARTILGYPVAEIQRLIQEFPAGARESSSETDAARERLKTGRNYPCPCGSGRKYKKCCLANDETVVRQEAVARQTKTIQRAELHLSSAGGAPDADVEPAEEPGLEDFAGEIEVPPEVEAEVEALWDDFETLEQPTVGQMDDFLGNLLALPPEATSWPDLMHRCARLNHPDLPAVFRRIAGALPHTKDIGMAFFYWGAAEEFVRHALSHLLPEVAVGFRKLDQNSYDADALRHIEDHLLAEHFEAETLELAEHFLPVLHADYELMPYAVPDLCNLIFELRVGQSLRAEPAAETSPASLAETFVQGIEEDIHSDSARHAAEIVSGQAPCPVWTRAQFELVEGDICSDNRAWQECLRLFGTLIRVAGEAWQTEQSAAGCGFRGLSLMLNSVYGARDEKQTKRKKIAGNLLDYLRPSGMERRLARASREIFGVNEPRARLLLEAHGILLRFALRHELITPADAALTEKELLRLRHQLGDPGA